MDSSETVIPEKFKTIFIYTSGDTIGDGIVKLPFLQILRQRFPDAHITWCAGLNSCSFGGALSPLTRGLLDEVIEEAGIGNRPSHLFGLRRPLAGRFFDLIIDTQSAIIRTLIARRIAHGLFVSATAGFIFSDLKPESAEDWPRNLVASLEKLVGLVVPRVNRGPLPALSPDPAFEDEARRLLPDGAAYVGLSPGAGDKEKCWPLDGFIEVAKEQAKKGRVPVFFLGPEEESWLAALKAEVPEARFPEWEVTDAERRPRGPLLVIALAGRLKAAVANDSGTGHMLAAGGVPLLSLFSKHDPLKYAPSAKRLAIIDSKDFGGVDPALIPKDVVIDALNHMVAGGTPRSLS